MPDLVVNRVEPEKGIDRFEGTSMPVLHGRILSVPRLIVAVDTSRSYIWAR